MYLTRSDKPISNKVLQLNHKANMTSRDNARTTSGHRRRGETYHNTRTGTKLMPVGDVGATQDI